MELERLLLDNGYLDAPKLCGYLHHGWLANTLTELSRGQNAHRLWQQVKDSVPSTLRVEPNKIHPKGVLMLVVQGQSNRTAFIVSISQTQVDNLVALLGRVQNPDVAERLLEYYLKTHAPPEITPPGIIAGSAWAIFRSNPKVLPLHFPCPTLADLM